ncbi:21217_t:CDS:2, partial [Racocetra persica]
GKIRNEKNFNLEKTFLEKLEKTFREKDEKDEKEEKESYTKTFPESKFQIIIKNKTLKFGGVGEGNKSYFFRELLEDYISDKFFIINYGSILMETFLFMKEDEWVEKLCKACHDLIFTVDGLKSTSDIQLLSIIIEVFPQLLQRHPIYLARFLSQTAFVLPLADPELILDSEIVSLSSEQHLYHFGTYNNLTEKTSLIDVIISKITKCWNKVRGKSESEEEIHHPPTSSESTISYSEATIKLLIPLPKPSASYSLDEPRFSSDPNDPWNLATKYSSVSEDGVISTQPSFIQTPTASDSSPISAWDLEENFTLIILSFSFSFFTTIYFMNLFIGLLSNEISETNNNESYLIQKAEILAEIELFYMLPHQRRNKDWFPEVIIYIAHVSELRDLIREIQIGNWQGFEKPVLSQTLLKAIQAEEYEEDKINPEEGSIKKLEDEIKLLKNMITQLIDANSTEQDT